MCIRDRMVLRDGCCHVEYILNTFSKVVATNVLIVLAINMIINNLVQVIKKVMARERILHVTTMWAQTIPKQ